LAGYVLKPLQGEAALVSSYIAQLPLHEGSLSPQAKEIVEQQVLDLLAVAFAKLTSGESPRLSSARSLVRTMIGSAIETRLTDLQLEPETIAAAVGVSVRYANSVLAQENTSIMRLLWFRRLERCRKALKDPSQARRMVSEIAYSCGFSDMTHFGRKFKATYGSSPRDYRGRWMNELVN
jgi:AraC-like DNA-binding protein